MNHRAILVLLAFAATGASSAVVRSDPQPDFKAIAERLHSTVVEVRAVAAVAVPGEKSQEFLPTATFGTGVFVGDGLVVTTLHTVGVALPGRMATWRNVEVLLPGGGAYAAEVAAWFPDVDLAVLRIPVTVDAAFPLATELPQRGATLLAMGAGDSVVNVVSVLVAGVAGDYLWMTSNLCIDSRYWGRPVFDAEGRLVGILLPSVTPRALTSTALTAMLDRVRAR